MQFASGRRPRPLPRGPFRRRRCDVPTRRRRGSSSRRPVDVVLSLRRCVGAGRRPVRWGSSTRARTGPGHFDGVLTVVAKLLHLVRPRHRGVRRERTRSRLALIRQNGPRPRLRYRDRRRGPPCAEPGGLAMSSRNAYLSDDERRSALVLHRALSAGDVHAARTILDREPAVTVDYLALVDRRHLARKRNERSSKRGGCWWPARIGTTRLIDNVSVSLGTRAG